MSHSDGSLKVPVDEGLRMEKKREKKPHASVKKEYESYSSTFLFIFFEARSRTTLIENDMVRVIRCWQNQERSITAVG